MKLGDRIPSMEFKMKKHNEERLKALKFHRVPEEPTLFYIKFPVVSNKNTVLLMGKVIVDSETGRVTCHLYDKSGNYYQAFYNQNANTDSYILKINNIYVSKLKGLGIKEIVEDGNN